MICVDKNVNKARMEITINKIELKTPRKKQNEWVNNIELFFNGQTP